MDNNISAQKNIDAWNRNFYYPIFTSKKEDISDEEFEREKQYLYEKFLNSPNIFLGGNASNATTAIRYVRKDNIAIANKFAEDLRYAFHQYATIMRNINTDNEEFALNILFDNNIDQRDYDFPHILQCVNKDNSKFAEKICKNQHFYSESIAPSLYYTNKKTINLAEALFHEGDDYATILPNVLKLANKDSINALGEIIAFTLRNNLPYPDFVIPALPEKLSKDDQDFIYNLYKDSDTDEYRKIRILYNIDKTGLKILQTAFQNKNLTKDNSYDLLSFKNQNTENIIEEISNRANKNTIHTYFQILDIITPNNKNFVLKLIKNEKVPIETKLELTKLSLSGENSRYYNIPEKLYDNGYSVDEIKAFCDIQDTKPEAAEYYVDTDIKKNLGIIKRQEELFFKYPEKYVNGHSVNQADLEDIGNILFRKETPLLIILADILDKETLDVLFRKRHLTICKVKDEINNLNYNQLKVLKEALNCTNIYGKPLLPDQKLDLLKLYVTYTGINANTKFIEDMIKSGKIDVGEVNQKLIIAMLTKLGLPQKIILNCPIEKIMSWDCENFHKLISEYNQIWADKNRIKDIIHAACCSDFKEYISDYKNIYGQANKITEKEFSKLNMNYHKWLNPSDANDVYCKLENPAKIDRELFAESIENDINALRATPAKSFIDKQLNKWIEDDKFKFPENAKKDYPAITAFTQTVYTTLNGVWKRAEENLEKAQNILIARDTITIRNHLKCVINELKQGYHPKEHAYYPTDIKIKMWNRFPQKDLFQGNYSDCCIGMNESQSYAMFDYILNTAFNMIEITDNTTGQTIGNALCFFAEDRTSMNSKVALVIDNIELKKNINRNPKNGIKLREAIAQYAKNIAKDVTGQYNTPIYLGITYNDVFVNDLEAEQKPLRFIGKIDKDCTVVYSDVYSGRITPRKMNKPVKIYNMEGKK